jgi:hypothetical protein
MIIPTLYRIVLLQFTIVLLDEIMDFRESYELK